MVPAPRNPAGPAPPRRPGSLRRTTTIDTHWPDGFGQPMIMAGRARDVMTPSANGAPVVLAEAEFTIRATAQREILAIDTSPAWPGIQQLVGVRAGGASRVVLNRLLGAREGTPLFQLLDDFAGASLVAGWIWSRWVDDWAALRARSGTGKVGGRGGSMEGVCTGFAPGSSALGGGAGMLAQNSAPVGSLINPTDPDGWHLFGDQQGIAMRRARRIDLWREETKVHADVGFQDSGTAPGGGRVAVHEYQVHAEIDAAAMTLSALQAEARILPYSECPGAITHIQRMIGKPVSALRAATLDVLPGTLGCTHLNDVIRSLTDVPLLATALAGGGEG